MFSEVSRGRLAGWEASAQPQSGSLQASLVRFVLERSREVSLEPGERWHSEAARMTL